MTHADYLERYRDIAPNFAQLQAVTAQPQPRALWLNPLIPCPFDPEERILAREPKATRIEHIEHAWRLPHDSSPGRWPEYNAGHFHAQEESTIWPSDLLGAKPGQKILDMCASPGNKTLRIALAMKDQGLLVANEKSWARLASLRYNLTRLGVTSVVTVCGDGCAIDADFGLFDAVLADVPCSCEGTARKSRGEVRMTTPLERKHLTDVQTGLLRKALSYVKPGGIVVYATCTYAPEENEGVLSRINPDIAIIEPIEAPSGVTLSPGITEWNGEDYRPDVIHSGRLWSHTNDSGGFFVAKLRRL